MSVLKLSINISVCISLILFSVQAIAQKDKNLSGSTVSTVDFKPKPADAVRIPVELQTENEEKKKPDIKYEQRSIAMSVQPNKAKLAAPAFKAPLDELNRNYFKGGFGNYGDIYWDYIYNTRRNRNSLFSARLKHHNGIGSAKNSQFSNNEFTAYGKKLIGTIVLDGDAGFYRNVNKYFALAELYPNTDTFRQRYNHVQGKLGINNNAAKDSVIHYQGNIGVHHFQDLYNSSETNFIANVGFFQLLKPGKLSIYLNEDYQGYRPVDTTNNRNVFRVNVALTGNYKALHYKVGFKTANQSTSNNTNFYIYPDLMAGVDLLKDKVTLYGLIDGNLESVYFRSLAGENPWILAPSRLENTNNTFQLKVGLKGVLGEKGYFNTYLSQSTLQNLYFYVNDSNDNRYFKVVYDTGNVTLLNYHLELGVKPSNKLDLSATLDLNNYNMSTLRQAYYRAPVLARVKAGYNVNNQFKILADVYYSGKRYATTLGEVDDIQLNSFVDANLSINYQLQSVKGLNLYLEFRNVLASKYQLYQYYDARRFQVTGGVIFHFL
ncbi:MAG: hypothetical protein SGJ04_04655 [Bacteroidota bacterium]|nr:hypothetical protein [Bacteroidota bacterium]